MRIKERIKADQAMELMEDGDSCNERGNFWMVDEASADLISLSTLEYVNSQEAP